MDLLKLLKLKENNKRITCIDFGGSFIKLVCLQSEGDKSNLLAYALKEFDTSSSTAEDLSVFIKQILESNPIFAKETYLSISDPEGIFIKKISLPCMSK